MGRMWKLVRVPAPEVSGNACCKCGYDLTSVAQLPPARSPPDTRCPECGKPVALRDNWRTDGRYSLSMLVSASWIIALIAATMVFVVARDNGPLQSPTIHPAFRPVVLAIGALPILTLLLFGPLFMGWMARRGAVQYRHADKRATRAYIPFAIVFVGYMLIAGRIFAWLGS